MENIVSQINEFKHKIRQIPDSETLDDIKELEVYESEIVDLIWQYSLSKNYNIDSFPEKYRELIENEDEDFGDFLSFDVKQYYILKCALIHKDVFLLVKTWYQSLEEDIFTDEDYKNDIQISIEILDRDKVNLDFNRADYNSGDDEPFRPKLP